MQPAFVLNVIETLRMKRDAMVKLLTEVDVKEECPMSPLGAIVAYI